MKSVAKGILPNKEQHPIHRLSVAAAEILDTYEEAHNKVGRGGPNLQINLPIWINVGRKILITLECGPETEAQHAIFKASIEKDGES